MATAARRPYQQGSREEVTAALETTYGACIQKMTTPKNTLASLDAFWRKTLPATLREREGKEGGAYVTKSDLYQIMKWKITRGKSRPLLHLIESNDDATIRRVSKAAFAALVAVGKPKQGEEEARVREAIEIMSQKAVRGVGPATATAVLGAYRGDLVPFMSDEACAAAVPSLGKLKYTLEEYMAFRKAVLARAKALGGGVTAEELGQALWALAKAEVLGIPPGGSGKKKGERKRGGEEGKEGKEGTGAKKARRG